MGLLGLPPLPSQTIPNFLGGGKQLLRQEHCPSAGWDRDGCGTQEKDIGA